MGDDRRAVSVKELGMTRWSNDQYYPTAEVFRSAHSVQRTRTSVVDYRRGARPLRVLIDRATTGSFLACSTVKDEMDGRGAAVRSAVRERLHRAVSAFDARATFYATTQEIAMWHRCFFLIAALVAGPVSAQQYANPTVIEGLIINANPCASASADLMGMEIGVNQLHSVSVERASLLIEGDIMTSSLTGSLACESSTGAVAPGFVSAGIDARVAIDLSDCVVGETSVVVSDVAVEIDMPELMSGMREFFEDQLPLLLEPALGQSLSDRAITVCQQLETGR